MKRSSLIRSIVVTFSLVAVMTSVTAVTAQSVSQREICPPGFVPRPPELNPALGECIPGSFTSNPTLIAVFDTDPGTCLPGFVRATSPLNPQLGCIPESIASNSFIVPIIDDNPATCPEGWRPVQPPLNPQLRCLPGEIAAPENGG